MTVEIDLSAGELVAPPLLADIDTDASGDITADEAKAFGSRYLGATALALDGVSQALTLVSVDVPSPEVITAGYGTIKLFADVAGVPPAGTHTVRVVNTYECAGGAYQVNAFVDRDAGVTLGPQRRSDDQKELTVDYTSGTGADDTATASSSADVVADDPTMAGSTVAVVVNRATETRSPWKAWTGWAIVVGAAGAGAVWARRKPRPA